MAKIGDVINQLITVLPQFTDKFSETVDITSLTRSGTTVTAVTATAHGYITGALVNIQGAEMPIIVSSLTRTGGLVSGTTAEDHDLTLGFQKTIEITGANETEYNGTHDLLAVPNRRDFKYAVKTTPSSPATGTILLFDGKERGYNGIFTITVTSLTTFTYEITTTPRSPSEGTIKSHSCFRISGGATIARITEAYSKQFNADKAWAFVVSEGTSTTKNRQFDNDATYSPDKGNEYRQQLIQQFHIYVFLPAKNQIAARQAVDDAIDIRSFIFKAVLGVPFRFNLTEDCNFLAAFVEDGPSDYPGSYYVHRYLFEITAWVQGGDIVSPQQDFAFRDIEIKLQRETPDDLSPTLDVDVDLDNEPL